MIPYSRQSINKDDVKNVIKVLKSDYITQGQTVKRFEDKICSIVKSKYAVASNSATSSLHISCIALGLKKGDWLWTSSNTFVASANCGRYCGANVDFVDIDENTFNISIDNLKQKLFKAKKKRILPKILVVVHFGGEPVNLKEIYKLSKKYNFKIIEDASHALGSKYKGLPIGRPKYSEIICFSFHPVKPITTAEGGVSVTNNLELAKKMRLLRNHGITRDIKDMSKKIKNYWYYEQQDLGYNYRMNDLEASLGLSQLQKLRIFTKKRQLIAKRYLQLLKNLPVKFQKIDTKNYSSYHLFVICLDLKKIQKKYNYIFEYLRRKKIGVNKHYLPVYGHPYYKKSKKYKKLKNVEKYASSALSLPIYYDLTFKQQEYVAKTLKQVLKNK